MFIISSILILSFNFIFCLDERYHTYEEVHQQLIDWDVEFGNTPNAIAQYPGSGIVYDLIEIGYSNNLNLPFWAVKLSYNADINEDEPKVLILGQCHAEEILGVEIAMEIIDWFLHPLEHVQIFNTVLKPILQNTEIWVVPTHNPEGLGVVHGIEIDGVYYQDETFRKNITDINLDNQFSLQQGVGNDSDGVDLNRNYGFNWFFGDSEFMLDPGYGDYFAHYDYYRGNHPFSESETRAIRDLALEHNFTLSIAYHSSRSGRVAEMVIYSWDWDDTKKSPDFPVIDGLGQEIGSMIPKEVEEGYYFCTPGKSRKGNAHDWFYTETGCIQYLVEVGTENLQPNEDLIEDTIERNMDAAFHLMNRAFYNPYGDADAYQVSGIVTDNSTGEPLKAEVEIEEMDGGMLKPRYTDTFGRYRRLLTNGTFNLNVHAKGYEKQSFEIIPSAGSITYQDIALNPLDYYSLNFVIDNYEDNGYELFILIEDEYGIDTSIVNHSNMSYSLPKNSYSVKVISDYTFPEIFEISLTNDITISLSVDEYENVFNDSFDNLINWNNQSGTWNLDNFGNIISQSNLLYQDSSHSFISLNNEITNETDGDLVIEIDWKYELEWENDTVYISIISDTDTLNEVWDDQFWDFHKQYVRIPKENFQSFYVDIGIKSDESVAYRGVVIDNFSIKSKASNLVFNEILVPEKSSFFSPYPNPFNPKVELSFYVSFFQNLDITIIDINGRLVDIVHSGLVSQGYHKINWDSKDLSSGVYFIKYELEDSFEIQKITLLK